MQINELDGHGPARPALMRSRGLWTLRGIVVLSLLLGAILAVAGCDKPQAAQAPAAAPLPEVGVMTLQPQRVALTTELPGRVSAFLVSDVRPQVSGIVLKRLFEEGSDVKEGQV